LQGILQIDFEDVRSEEYSPSHAGSASRIDFLLKEDKIGIEVKYATENNNTRKLKSQISGGKEHYPAHSDCENLICYIYNPDSIIDNLKRFEKGLIKRRWNIKYQDYSIS
jgi:predicted AAA+ superfamily ATPase